MKKLNDLFYSFLQVAASTQKLGINLIRISILIIFVWIGGLKFWNYEAEGIVPFVANSPFMSFFYTKSVLMPFPFFLLVTVYSVRYSGLRRSRFAESGVLPGDRKR